MDKYKPILDCLETIKKEVLTTILLEDNINNTYLDIDDIKLNFVYWTNFVFDNDVFIFVTSPIRSHIDKVDGVLNKYGLDRDRKPETNANNLMQISYYGVSHNLLTEFRKQGLKELLLK